MQNLKPAVFLDRDGTINVDKDYLFRIEDFEYLDGTIEGLKLFQEKGYQLVIITNQSGIARGYYKEDDFFRLNTWMLNDLAEKGIHVAGVYYCPHHPNACIAKYKCECGCRKPRTELFWRAQKELSIDMDRSIAIGDRERDLSICRESNVRGFLLKYGENLLNLASRVTDLVN